MRERFQSGHSRSAAFSGVPPFLTSLTEATPGVIPVHLLHPKVMISEIRGKGRHRGLQLSGFIFVSHQLLEMLSTSSNLSLLLPNLASASPCSQGLPGDPSKAQLCPGETPTMLKVGARVPKYKGERRKGKK